MKKFFLFAVIVASFGAASAQQCWTPKNVNVQQHSGQGYGGNAGVTFGPVNAGVNGSYNNSTTTSYQDRQWTNTPNHVPSQQQPCYNRTNTGSWTKPSYQYYQNNGSSCTPYNSNRRR